MFSFLVLSLNVISLFGIILGLSLSSSIFRSAIERGYIFASDATAGKLREEYISNITESLLRSAWLGKSGALSARKVGIIATLSTMLFLAAMGVRLMAGGPYSRLLGGGLVADTAVTIGFFALVWCSHFLYDFSISYILLKLFKQIKRWS